MERREFGELAGLTSAAVWYIYDGPIIQSQEHRFENVLAKPKTHPQESVNRKLFGDADILCNEWTSTNGVSSSSENADLHGELLCQIATNVEDVQEKPENHFRDVGKLRIAGFLQRRIKKGDDLSSSLEKTACVRSHILYVHCCVPLTSKESETARSPQIADKAGTNVRAGTFLTTVVKRPVAAFCVDGPLEGIAGKSRNSPRRIFWRCDARNVGTLMSNPVRLCRMFARTGPEVATGSCVTACPSAGLVRDARAMDRVSD